MSPEEIEERLALARGAIRAGDHERALRTLDRLRAQNLENVRLLHRIGADEVLAALRGRAAFAVFDAFRSCAEATDLEKHGRVEDAIAGHLEAIERSRECLPSFVALERLARDLEELDRFTELRLSRRPVESVEDLGYWFIRVAGAPGAARLGHPAEKIVARLLREHPGESVAHFTAAQWRARLGDVEGAVRALTRVVELLPDVDGAWLVEELADFEEFDTLAHSPELERLVMAIDEARDRPRRTLAEHRRALFGDP
jgi:tetratricopeptide (TPR) repeat protein